MKKKSSLARGFQLQTGQLKRLMNKKVFIFNFILQDSALGRTDGTYFRNIGPWLSKCGDFPVEIVKLFGILILALIM